MNDNYIAAQLAIAALASTFFLGHMISTRLGIEEQVLAYQATNVCVAIRASENFVQDDYDACLRNLEIIVWKLMDKNKLNLKKCQPDVKGLPQAWCKVWVGYWWGKILITNTNLVNYISAPAFRKPKVPTLADEPTTTTTTPAPPPPPPPPTPKPNMVRLLKNKLNNVGERVSAWRESTEAIIRGDEPQPPVDRVVPIHDAEKQAGEKEPEDFDETAEKRTSGRKVKGDKMDELEGREMTHAERAGKLAEDLKAGVGGAAKFALDSVNDLRDKVANNKFINRWRL